uniref:YbaB/EbfC family DNA-binding protein n=1 Tax=candidate division CPR3 bacterium TaxID=2268181 RepID=A0A7C4R3X1_UNCC3
MFDKVKDLYKLKQQATALQKELGQTIIEAISPDDLIKVEISADLKIQSVFIDPSYLIESRKEQLEFQLKNVLTSAIVQAQQVAANKMKEMGGLDNLLGGLGM